VSEEGLDSVRKQLDQVEKENKQLKDENSKLLNDNRLYQAKEAFVEADLSPALAKLFVASEPTADISAEAAKAFAEAYGVAGVTAQPAPVDAAPEATPEPATPDNPSMALMGRAGSRGGEGGQPSADAKTYSVQEYQALARTDPEAARQAVAKGQVKFSDNNGWLKDRPNQTGANPFANRGEATE
jgi:hypothetical protein